MRAPAATAAGDAAAAAATARPSQPLQAPHLAAPCPRRWVLTPPPHDVRLRLLKPGVPASVAAAGPVGSRGVVDAGDAWQDLELPPQALAALPALLLQLLPDASRPGAAAQLPGGGGMLALRRLPPPGAPGAPVLQLSLEPAGGGPGGWSAGLLPEQVQQLVDVLDDVAAQCPGVLEVAPLVGGAAAPACLPGLWSVCKGRWGLQSALIRLPLPPAGALASARQRRRC